MNRVDEIQVKYKLAQGDAIRFYVTLYDEIPYLLSENKRLKIELEDKNGRMKALEARRDTLTRERELLISAYDAERTKVSAMQTEIDRLTAENLWLKKRLTEKDAELEAYKQAEKEGLLVRLPIPLYTKVYEIMADGTVAWTQFRYSDYEEYGRTLFLTEAEAKKHMEGKGDD